MIVHFLWQGFTLCAMAGTPNQWPDDHRWVSAGQEHLVTCVRCLAEIEMKKHTPRRPVSRHRIEVYRSHAGIFRTIVVTDDWITALKGADLRMNRRVRIRTFYDRHLRIRVTQILVGRGIGIRGDNEYADIMAAARKYVTHQIKPCSGTARRRG